MANFFNQLFTASTGEDALVRVFVALAILVFGHLAVKLVKKGLESLWINRKDQSTRLEVQERKEALKYLEYILDAAVIILGLLYLNTGLTSDITASFVSFIPRFLSILLIGILGFIAINLSLKIGGQLLKALGIGNYFRDVGLSDSAINVVTTLVKAFLYLVLLQIALGQLGIGNTFINKLVTASSWAAAFLAAALVFYGFKDLVRNFASGVYLKNSRLVRPGEEVRLGDENGEITDISLFSTTLNTDSGYTLVTPNSRIMDSDIRFKRTKTDIETLEDIKSYFVAEEPSYCGPASVEMALEIFGRPYDQGKIAEKSGDADGEHRPEKLAEAVEELTDRKVRAGFLESDKIADMVDEFKAWFKDGGLIVPVFDKPSMLPDADSGSYVLSVGVEGDEILVVDPGRETGGVYYTGKDQLRAAMEELENGGYLVLAPEGTNAYWRIKNGLLYAEKNYYDEISKTLETKLRKILRQGRLLKNVTPSSLESYMEKWRSEEPVTRLWEPKGDGNEGSDGN